MNSIYRNYFVHNMVAHPLHEIVYLTMRLLMFGKSRSRRVSDWIHDVTIPSKPCTEEEYQARKQFLKDGVEEDYGFD